MSRNNDVFQVLVTKDNVAPLTSGTLNDLAPNQIGAFNADTNEAIDGTSPVREFYLAVGVDRDNDGTVEAIATSAGQVIQSRNIRAYSFRPHTAARPMILEINDYTAHCDTEYAVRLEFRNQEIYRRQGYNQFTHTYAVKTDCCETCEDCPKGDVNKLTKKLVEAFNADEYGLVIAEAIDASGNVIADIDAFIAANETVNEDDDDTNDVTSGVRLTTVPVAVNNFCSINLKYFKPRGTVIIPSLIEGFSCNGTTTIVQEAAFEEGSGYDVKQKEYHAGGWNGKPGPYRQSTATGLALDGFEYFADTNVKYNQIALTYDQFSVAGWGEHLNNLATVIAIPTADAITIAGLLTVLDNLVTPQGFDALSDDAALANPDDDVVEPTADIDDVDADGIG